MNKLIFQALFLIGFFLSGWFLFSQLDWLTILKVQDKKDKTEEKLGEFIWDSLKKTSKEEFDPLVINVVDSLVSKLCTSNDLDRDDIKVHILQNDEVNAFALPNGHLVIYTGLILDSDNQEALIGVIGHEIAHIQENHVMKKLVKEIGLATLIAMTGGNSGSGALNEVIKLVTSTAYDRSLEKEADMSSVDYMLKAKIDPEPFANFLYKLSIPVNGVSDYLSWVSTHPESKERAEYIIVYIKGKSILYENVISKKTWEDMILILEQE